MKKNLVLSVILLSALSINASVFIDMYNKNYGKIDRSIMVFDAKPKYRIIENDYDIQVNISNCKKDLNIQDITFPENEVIESYDFYSTEDKVMVIITIDQRQDLQKNIKYRLDVFEDEGTYFRLILDIFATNTPKSYLDYVGFATYYEDTNRPEMALPYREMVQKLEIEMPELTRQTETTPAATSDKLSLQMFFTPNRIILSLLGLLLLAALFYLLHHFRKPKTIEVEDKTGSYRELNGFGRENFRRKMIKKLKDFVWDEDTIAMEMELNPKIVYKEINSDLDAELERI